MKKLSHEVRVGAVALITIVLFIWLFSFLKGENVFSNTDRYTVIYYDVAGLEESSPVEINGFKAGIVRHVNLMNDGSGRISVVISIIKDFRLPTGSVAEITTATLIAGMKIQMIMSESNSWYSSGDTIPGRVAISILDKVESNFEPVMVKVDSLISGLESAVSTLNILLTPEFMEDIRETGENMAMTTGSISKVAGQTEKSIPELVESMNSFAMMLENNTGKLDSTIGNISMISDSLAAADIAGTINNLKLTLEETSKLLAGLNDGKGSAGKIMTDDSLYINLSNSLKSLNELLIDLQKNPGDYVRFSVFGGKQKD